MHKTIGEFLVAELICDGTTHLPDKRRLDRKELWEHRHEDQWTAVLFFWAGKTSPRELEEFLGDLLNEATEGATLLALSLLYDQGDRLTHETQRSLATRLISKPFQVAGGLEIYSCETPLVPDFMFKRFWTHIVPLRGLSEAASSQAFVNFFRRGLLDPNVIQQSHGLFRDHLTVAALLALRGESSKVTLDVRHCLGHLPSRDVALFCFSNKFRRVMRGWGTTERCCTDLAEWLEAFPEGRPWVSLLLLGLVTQGKHEARRRGGWNGSESYPRGNKLIGPLLWERRNEPVDENWLRGSDDCAGVPGIQHADILNESRKCVSEGCARRMGPDGRAALGPIDLVRSLDRTQGTIAGRKGGETPSPPVNP